MPYELKPLSCNPTGLNGLSEKLIVSHWENNYGGAVKRLNAIKQKLAGATPLIGLDMHEHSYHMDFGAKAGAYVDAFMQNLSWTAAEAAFAKLGA